MNSQFRRLALDLGPLMVFFIGFKYLGIFGATAAFMAAVLIALAAGWLLEKIARVIKKLDASAPHAVLLVLDATTGQNAIAQVEAFGTSVPLTGLVMTKLDGTAKGGILVALAAKFALPVHFIGVGEGEDDLMPFDAVNFATALTGAA